MAQFSLPQSGLVTAGDGDDCGSYTGNEWAAILIAANRSGGMIVTGAAAPPGLPAAQTVPNIGIYYAYADRLEVTSPGASQISIAVGAAIVDGRVYRNDTAITATAITNPAANPRIDRVVIRQNYTLIDYTSVNAAALIVDFNTARICIISGAEAVGPVAPTLTQDEDRATYWDIPLYQYEIAVGGAITGLTDEREWVDAEIKRHFAPALVGLAAATLNLEEGISNITGGIRHNTAVASTSWGHYIIPNDYISGLVIKGVVVSNGNGDVWTHVTVKGGACAENLATHIAVGTSATITVVQGDIECRNEVSTELFGVGDYINPLFNRDGTHVSDTLATYLLALGWNIEYLGWGRR